MSTRDAIRRALPPALRPVARRIALTGRAAAALSRRMAPHSTRSREFSRIYRTHGWRGTVASGPGSDLEQTEVVRAELPNILRQIGARSFLDAPCGDFHWMRECQLPVERYIGADIVPEMIEELCRTWGSEERSFILADLVTDDLPQVDVIFCRDCLVHLPLRHALGALANFKRSGSTYLLTTTFTEWPANGDIERPGLWRKLNLAVAPFDFAEPVVMLNERCQWGRGLNADKSLGLWRLSDLEV